MDEAKLMPKPADEAEQGASPQNYQIEATESLVERTLRTLKHNDLFAVFDRQGNFQGGANGPDGLFYQDTRFLSHLSLKLGGLEPLQLGSVVLDDNGAMVVDLTNADLRNGAQHVWLQRDAVHVSRFKFLRDDTSFERIRVRRYWPIGREVDLDIAFDADFADLFEVRGTSREARGTTRVDVIDDRCVEYAYVGLDGIERRTRIHFDPAPDRLTKRGAHWDLDLDASEHLTIVMRVCCRIGEDVRPPATLARSFRDRGRRCEERDHARLTSSNPQFDTVMARAWSDLDMLLTETPSGPYPYAGVPWYSTIFGRDGIITALQMLWCAPYMARGVLRALAHLQADRVDAASDAEPGKILHEMRGGEMANLGEVPFKRYYGSVDSTPLFVLLAARYYDRTGDLDTIRNIWPNIRAALQWMDSYGDVDGDGFLEYARMTEKGLTNQGWKDSSDSIFHADGRLAHGPIALCEVQAYAFGAKKGAARLAKMLGDGELANALNTEAERLRQRFEEQFWVEELGSYALALDDRKRPCRVLSSNAGQVLLTGIASPERAERLAELLTSERFFSGWGIRTIAVGEARYNPMSYHNGSVWPHDNALIAMGLAQYGLKAAVNRIFEGVFDAATYDEFRRLPELFCGFNRRRHRGYTAYPVACSPQAWAAAAPFALIGAAIGCELDVGERLVRLRNPVLPPFLSDLSISGLNVGGGSVDLKLARVDSDVTTAVAKRSGDLKVQILK